MSKVNDIIKEWPIPADVIGVEDTSGDKWTLRDNGLWTCLATEGIADAGEKYSDWSAERLATRYTHLTVTAVREPERKVERAGWPAEPEPVPFPAGPHPYERGPYAVDGSQVCGICGGGQRAVLHEAHGFAEPDEVVHYRIPGDASALTLCGEDVWDESTNITERAGSSNCTGCRAAADEGKADAPPEQGCPGCGRTQHLGFACIEMRDDRPAAQLMAEVERLKLQVRDEIGQADEHAAWADRLAWAALKRTGVRETEEASGNEELWRLALDALTARPDPLVLSLPTVPPGTVALDGESGARFIPCGAVSWRGANRLEDDPTYGLGELLDFAGPMSVVMREPRTWPKLDKEPDDISRTIEVEGHGRFVIAVRRPYPDNNTTFIHEDDAADGGLTWTLGRLRELGDVTEVFEDEPGGEPR
jgi:hypothetical protein